MKNTRSVAAPILLGLSLVACQPQTADTVSTASAEEVVASVTKASSGLAAGVSARENPSDSLRLLQTLDLAPLWARTVAGRPAESAMDGFYGDDSYHIAFYFDSVRRDPRQPTRYHIWGRERFKHVTTSFSGTCTITRLAALPDTAALFNSQQVHAYSAVAAFALRENPQAKGAGSYTGHAYLDFCVDPSGRPIPCEFVGIDTGTGNPTKGSGLLFRGTWRSNHTGQTKPVAWAGWYEAVVPDALRKLGLGERGAELSPKLAQHGWGEKWDNEEWWADSPKPSLNL